MYKLLFDLPLPLIFILVFTVTYALAALATYLVGLAIRHSIIRKQFNISHTMLTITALQIALVVAFMNNIVLSDLDRARSATNAEADALKTVVTLSVALPQTVQQEMRGLVRDYAQTAMNVEWPLLAEGRLSSRLGDILQHMRSIAIMVKGEPDADALTIEHYIGKVAEARQARYNASRASLDPVQWFVIVLLVFIVFLVIAIVHFGARRDLVVAQFLYASSIAALLFMILIYDHPFDGAVRVEPRELANIAAQLR